MSSDVCSLSEFPRLVLPALCCFWLKEGVCDFADCVHQPVSGTENMRPRHCFHSCCIMNVLMSLSRLESPAGMQPDAPRIFATTPTSAHSGSVQSSPLKSFQEFILCLRNKLSKVQGHKPAQIFLSLLTSLCCCLINPTLL